MFNSKLVYIGDSGN